jgi:hypothetical protein
MSDSVSPDSTTKLDPTLDFLAGTAAGISGLLVGFPFDTGGGPFPSFPYPFLDSD